MRTDPRELLAVGIFGAHSRLGERIEQLVRGGRAFSPRIARETVAAGAILLGVLAFAGSLMPRWIAFAQETRPTFEVASVKPNTSNAHTGYGRPTGGRFSATNTSLKALVALAYKLPPYEVFGAPGWVESARYDIDARAAETSIPDDQFRLMLQALLADRFKLAAHTETRDEPIYTLTIVKTGLKAAKSKEGGCTPFTPGSTPPQPSQPPPCGAMGVGPNFLDGARITPAVMIRGLSDLLGRPVIDKTGYNEAFDFHLRFRMEGVASWGAGGFGRPELPPNNDDSDLPTIFTALRESLGMSLQAQRGPVEVLVIDRIEKPDEN
ncbi:MAG TPA: TIGR03435 family protein [Bryobacteraceae bacterium]|jgi:uncharacterized protein (TIGR03435 family)|nr:TIGR03435 family protein [Bryobacteraceae bacterium]